MRKRLFLELNWLLNGAIQGSYKAQNTEVEKIHCLLHEVHYFQRKTLVKLSWCISYLRNLISFYTQSSSIIRNAFFVQRGIREKTHLRLFYIVVIVQTFLQNGKEITDKRAPKNQIEIHTSPMPSLHFTQNERKLNSVLEMRPMLMEFARLQRPFPSGPANFVTSSLCQRLFHFYGLPDLIPLCRIMAPTPRRILKVG